MKILSIYKITNILNGKGYIGLTSMDPLSRYQCHLSVARTGGGYAIHQAIRKYGEENFHHEVLCCTKDKIHLKELEIELILDHDTKLFGGNGYNMTDGGDFASCIGTCTAKESSTGNSLGRVDLNDPRWECGMIVPANLGMVRDKEFKVMMSKLAKERVGNKNPKARWFWLIDPTGDEYLLNGNTQKFCKEKGICHSALYTYLNKGAVPPPSRFHPNVKPERLSTVGWGLKHATEYN